MLDPTANLLSISTLAELAEDELILDVLEAAGETMFDAGATLEELVLAVLLAATEEATLDPGAVALDELSLAGLLDTAEDATLDVGAVLELALAVLLDPTEDATLELDGELALAVLDTAEEVTLEATFELEGVTLEDEPALDELTTAEEATLELGGATVEDEPALVKLETAEEATTELEVWATTEDALDEPATLLLITTLAEADEDVLVWIALELEDLVSDADGDRVLETDG